MQAVLFNTITSIVNKKMSCNVDIYNVNKEKTKFQNFKIMKSIGDLV